MLGYAALAAAVLAIGHALSPTLLNSALSGSIPIWGALTILATTAALLASAGYVADRSQARPMLRETLTSAGVVVVLIGAFLALRAVASGVALDRLAENALFALVLFGAGHAVLPRAGQEMGRVGLWRGHTLIGGGVLYTVIMAGVVLNPWWGQAPAPVIGPPMFDTVLLAFAAPAVLAALAAYRLYARDQQAGRVYAAAGSGLALMWAVLETRRLFHGTTLDAAPVGVLEGAIYSLIVLAIALGVAFYARAHARDRRPFQHDVLSINPVATIAAIAVAGLIMLLVRHPWWGGQAESASTDVGSAMALLAQAAAAGIAITLGWLHNTTHTTALPFTLTREPARPEDSARFAAAAGVALFGWSLGHGAIRWLYHQGAMDDGNVLSGLEGYAHAIWPLVFVLAAWEATERLSGGDNVARSYPICRRSGRARFGRRLGLRRSVCACCSIRGGGLRRSDSMPQRRLLRASPRSLSRMALVAGSAAPRASRRRRIRT